MQPNEQIVHIHPKAPSKATLGTVCNGCGVCCLYAPCPLGIVLSRRRSGACSALRWDPEQLLYRCGAIVAPQEVLVHALPRGARALASTLAPWLRRLGLRWIAAGTGCDSNLEVTMPSLQSQKLTSGSTILRHPPL